MLPEDERQGPVIRDRRRVDPATGQVRVTAEPGPQQRGPGSGGASGGTTGNGGDQESRGTSTADAEAAAKASALLAERTADLQRLQAEYANYRKRVDRDRLLVREQALANVLNELLPVLDDIGRAREHGELTGGFKSVADSLEGITVKLGLTSYGENGDPFDPTMHEALMHEYSENVAEPTCIRVLQPGYKVGERIIRPARVAVAEPAVAEPGVPGSSVADSDVSTAEPGEPGAAEDPGADAADTEPTEPGSEKHGEPGGTGD